MGARRRFSRELGGTLKQGGKRQVVAVYLDESCPVCGQKIDPERAPGCAWCFADRSNTPAGVEGVKQDVDRHRLKKLDDFSQ